MVRYQHHSDFHLVSLLRQSDQAAFDEIYRRYWKPLFNDAQKRLGNLELSEELVQDVFVDLWQNRAQKKINSLYPYLATAVRYQVFLIYRKRKQIPRFEEPLEHQAFATEQTDAPCYLQELLAGIHAWLTQQPEKRREIFRLRLLESLSTKEISEHLNIAQKTVQNQLIIGQESLRSAISKLLMLLVLSA